MDYRKPLEQLKAEWGSCRRCDLSTRRFEHEYPLVFGEGSLRGVMFIGEGPGKDEEVEGVPFTGYSGRLLRFTIQCLGLPNCYFTNIVACRSCGVAYNGEGQVVMGRPDRRTGISLPLIQDAAPNPIQTAQCAPRLWEQIYLVDPVLIVTLGAEASKAVIGKNISITAESGSTHEAKIPGAWHKADLTDKLRAWGRRVSTASEGKKERHVIYPTVPNRVSYLVMPVLHPAYVLRNKDDRRENNPAKRFAEDMRRASTIYDRYLWEVYGVRPTDRTLLEESIRTFEEER